MGRWSQARRTGGGPPTAAQPLNFIDAAGITDANTATLNYAEPVTAGDLTAGAFESTPSNEIANAVSQNGPTAVDLNFPGDISLDIELTYSGADPGFTTPQTVPYT